MPGRGGVVFMGKRHILRQHCPTPVDPAPPNVMAGARECGGRGCLSGPEQAARIQPVLGPRHGVGDGREPVDWVLMETRTTVAFPGLAPLPAPGCTGSEMYIMGQGTAGLSQALKSRA